METIIDFERMASAHWRGTEEEWLGDWLLRAAEGFTGRANSALPLGDPGLPLDEALVAVTQWYRARELPPMIVVPTSLQPDSHGQALDNQLSERMWLTCPGPAFVMLADLPLRVPPDGLAADREIQLSPEPDDAWAARYHYRGQDHLPPVARKVLTSAREQSFMSIRDGGEVLAIARLSIAGLGRHHRGRGAPGPPPSGPRGRDHGGRVRRGRTTRRLPGLPAGGGGQRRRGRCTRGSASATRTATTTASPRRRALEPSGLRGPEFPPNRRHAWAANAREKPGYSLRLGLWLPLGPGARQARGAGGRALSAVTTTTTSRPR